MKQLDAPVPSLNASLDCPERERNATTRRGRRMQGERSTSRHLGRFSADRLSLREVDGYRDARLKETTQRGGPPSPATLDREVELLKRMLSYAVKAGLLTEHPLGAVVS